MDIIPILPNSGILPDIPANQELKQALTPAQRKALHQFKPGQSGNPRGRISGVRTYSEILKDIGKRKIKDCAFIPDEIKKKLLIADPEITIKEALAMSAVIRALNEGDKHALDFVADREEGKAPETIKVTDDRVIIDIDDNDNEEDDQVNEDNQINDSGIDDSDSCGDSDGTV